MREKRGQAAFSCDFRKSSLSPFLSGVILLGILMFAVPAWTEISEETILSKVEAFYGKADDLSAEFVQKTFMEGFDERISKGKLSLKKPGMARWYYRSPVKQQIFISPAKVIVYDPGQNQAVVQGLSDHPDAEPAMGLLSSVEKWRTLFGIRLLPRESGNVPQVGLELIPRTRKQIEKIRVQVDPETGVISQLTLFQEGDSRITFEFSKITINQGLKNSFFNFTIPPGTEILEYPR